jgi:hypothetical protein
MRIPEGKVKSKFVALPEYYAIGYGINFKWGRTKQNNCCAIDIPS